MHRSRHDSQQDCISAGNNGELRKLWNMYKYKLAPAWRLHDVKPHSAKVGDMIQEVRNNVMHSGGRGSMNIKENVRAM